MARFKYLGEPPRPELVVTYGPCYSMRCHYTVDPSCKKTLTPIPPATEFVVGADIGYDITDETMLRMMRTDTDRFEEIV